MFRLPSNVGAMRGAWRAVFGHEERNSPCYRMETGSDTAKLYVFDVIGGWDLDAATFVKEVSAVTSPTISVHINSPGGFVYDAIAMYEALRDHFATVNVKIDGLAASAASFLAMAGDSIEIARSGRMMIHDAQVLAYGSPAHLRTTADLGDEISNDIAGIYAERTGEKVSAWRERMQAETWYSAQQAVDAKLVDKIKTSVEDSKIDNTSKMIHARARVALRKAGK